MGPFNQKYLLRSIFNSFAIIIPGRLDPANNAPGSLNLETIILRLVIRTRAHPRLDRRMKLGALVNISGATHVGRKDNGFPFSFDELEALEER